MSSNTNKPTSPPPAELIRSYEHKPNSIKSIFLIHLWLGATLILTVLGLALFLVPGRTFKAAMLIFIILLFVLPLPKSTKTTNPFHRLGYALGDEIMNAAATYFGLSVYADDVNALAKATTKHCSVGNGGIVIPLCPHDVLPYAIFAFNPCLNVFEKTGFGHTGHMFGLMTAVLFQLPFVRHIYSYCLAGDVGKKNFTKILQNGETACFIPGGLQEVIIMHDNPGSTKIFLYLNKRKGFVKLALIHGSCLVPAFCFGIDGSYTFKVMPGPKKLIEKIAQKIGFLPMMYFGRWMVPLGIARPNKITVCVGNPISAVKKENPSGEDIEELHKQFCDGITAVFEANKERLGYGDRELCIV